MLCAWLQTGIRSPAVVGLFPPRLRAEAAEIASQARIVQHPLTPHQAYHRPLAIGHRVQVEA